MGTSLVFSWDRPGAANYTEPHIADESKYTTANLVKASGAETDDKGVHETVRCLRGILRSVNRSSKCARDPV